jgi:2'-hydroxyisoflavone reductase
MVENGETGIYNATGPAKKLGIGEMLNGIKKANKSTANFTWVAADFLAAQKVEPWSDMPVWLPPRGPEAGGNQVSNQRALAKGLTFRPLAETARDTLAWFKSLPQDRQTHLKTGLTAEREAEVLTAWKKREMTKSE